MKIKVDPKNNEYSFDMGGKQLENVTEFNYSVAAGEISKATFVVNHMDEDTFEAISNDNTIDLDCDSLFGYPTYEIIKHLRKLGYKVEENK